MKRKLTLIEIMKLLRAVVWTVAAVLIFIFREYLSWSALYLVGGLMLVYGSISMASHLILKKSFFEHNDFFWGLAEVVLGLFMLLLLPATDNAYVVGCCVWGVWELLRASLEIEESVKEFKHDRTVVLPIIESLVSIVFSLLLLLEPGQKHALAHVVLLSIELLTTGLIFPLISFLIGLGHAHRQKKKEELASKEPKE